MKRPEQALQQAVYKYIRYAAPHVLCFHVPNGGKRSKVEAGIFKTMGVMPGVADLLLFWSVQMDVGGFMPYMAAIELKAGKGKQTDHQKQFQRKWVALGGDYAVCTSIDDVDDVLKEWGAIA